MGLGACRHHHLMQTARCGSHGQLVAARSLAGAELDPTSWATKLTGGSGVCFSEKGAWESTRQRPSLLWKAIGKQNIDLSGSCVAGCVGVWELANRLDERSCAPWGDRSRGVVRAVWFPWYCMQIISVQLSELHPAYSEVNNRTQTVIPRYGPAPAVTSQMRHRKGQGAPLRGSFPNRSEVSCVRYRPRKAPAGTVSKCLTELITRLHSQQLTTGQVTRWKWHAILFVSHWHSATNTWVNKIR